MERPAVPARAGRAEALVSRSERVVESENPRPLVPVRPVARQAQKQHLLSEEACGGKQEPALPPRPAARISPSKEAVGPTRPPARPGRGVEGEGAFRTEEEQRSSKQVGSESWQERKEAAHTKTGTAWNGQRDDGRVVSSASVLGTLRREVSVAALELAIEFVELPDSEALVEACNSLSVKSGTDTGIVRDCTQQLVFLVEHLVDSRIGPDQLREQLSEKAGLEQALCEELSQVWAKHLVNLMRVRSSNAASVNRLVDIDWKLGFTLANSDLAKVGSPFVQLRLDIDSGKREAQREHFELPLDVFYELLASGQAAMARLQVINN